MTAQVPAQGNQGSYAAYATPQRRYVRPKGAVHVHAVLRLIAVVDDQGGHLEPEVAVAVGCPWRHVRLGSVAAVTMPQGALASPLSAPGALREAFDKRHPKAAAIIADLSARSEQFLAGLRMGEEPAEVLHFGQALEVVHRELAGADRMRREWIARQGGDLRELRLDIGHANLLNLEHAPAVLPRDVEVPFGVATELAESFGLLLVIVDGDEGSGDGLPILALYRRVPSENVGDATVTPGAWLRDDSFVTAVPETALARIARCQLDLLDVSPEYARLAVTHQRDGELSALEREARLADVARPRSAHLTGAVTPSAAPLD